MNPLIKKTVEKLKQGTYPPELIIGEAFMYLMEAVKINPDANINGGNDIDKNTVGAGWEHIGELTSFPEIDVSKIKDMDKAWSECDVHYSHDEEWRRLKKESEEAYKRLKDREYDLPINFKETFLETANLVNIHGTEKYVDLYEYKLIFDAKDYLEFVLFEDKIYKNNHNKFLRYHSVEVKKVSHTGCNIIYGYEYITEQEAQEIISKYKK